MSSDCSSPEQFEEIPGQSQQRTSLLGDPQWKLVIQPTWFQKSAELQGCSPQPPDLWGQERPAFAVDPRGMALFAPRLRSWERRLALSTAAWVGVCPQEGVSCSTGNSAVQPMVLPPHNICELSFHLWTTQSETPYKVEQRPPWDAITRPPSKGQPKDWERWCWSNLTLRENPPPGKCQFSLKDSCMDHGSPLWKATCPQG